MLKVKKKNKTNKKNKKILTIISLVFLLIGISLIIVDKLYIKAIDKKENEAIEEFIEIQQQEIVVENQPEKKEEEKVEVKETTYNYIGVLEIPKINFKRGFLAIDDKNNVVSKNIQVLKQSDMPDVEGGNFIIAGHSGTGRIAFFTNLNKVEKEDIIYIYYGNEKYLYKVLYKYEVDKTGSVPVKAEEGATILTLITCSEVDESKQIVIVASRDEVGE